MSWIKNKPSTVALLNGVIAGLAGITPASGTEPDFSNSTTILKGLGARLHRLAGLHRCWLDLGNRLLFFGLVAEAQVEVLQPTQHHEISKRDVVPFCSELMMLSM